MKWDGHTHTEFCPHGSGDTAEAMVRKAVELGFTRYSCTEHAPLPRHLAGRLPESQRDAMKTSNMAEKDTDAYIKEMLRLKEVYKDKIQIFVGFEVDYVEGVEAWYREFFREYGQWTDDGVLSVHYLQKDGQLHPLDCSRDYVVRQLIPSMGGFGPYCDAYYRTVLDSIHADLGPHGPRRIGHMSLCRKYQLAEELQAEELQAEVYGGADGGERVAEGHGFEDTVAGGHGPEDAMAGGHGPEDTAGGHGPEDTTGGPISGGPDLAGRCLEAIRSRGYALDFNTAGLFKPLCHEFYPGESLVRRALQMHIPLVYGSDSHGMGDLGRGYQIFVEFPACG